MPYETPGFPATRRRGAGDRRGEPSRRPTYSPRPPTAPPRGGRPHARRPATRPHRRAAVDQALFARRIRFFRLIVALAFLAVAARLTYVQVFESSRYRAAAGQELTQKVSLPSQRGTIYDRGGQVLAISEPTKNVVADDFQVNHPLTEAQKLAPMLGLDPLHLAALLSEHSGYVVLAKDVATTEATKIAADAFTGITFVDNSVRVDPVGDLAQPVIGGVHASGTGASGLEYQYNKALAGTAGSETLLESASGVALPGVPVADHRAGQAGTGLELTLDEQLQYATEQDLAAQIVKTHAVSGIAEVMDVRTGDILSMANLVNNDTSTTAAGQAPTAPATTTPPAGQAIEIGAKGPVSEAASNLAVSQLYEPGSVFKLVTFSAALADGVITPDSSFSVPDQITVDGSVFHDAEPHPTLEMTATDILAQSSNIGTSEIATRLGEERLLAQVHKLGFGAPTGLDFPGEQDGILADEASWEPTDVVSLPIGQVDAVSAQQVLDAYNAVANGGVMVAPRLVQATVGAGGKAAPTPPSASHRVIPASTDAQLVSMLEQVVKTGTGTNAFIPGYSVAGKTGTAQIPAAGGASYVPGAYMASFVGTAPATHPEFSMIVVLDRPTPIFGGTVAAPVFSQLMGYALHRYDIPATAGAPTTPPPPGTVASTLTGT